MTIIMTIFKIIGTLLLVLFLLLLFCILLVLFFPVGYSVRGISGEDVAVKGKVFWLFHAVSVRFSYEEKEVSFEVRLFGIRLKKKKPPLSEEYDEYSLEEPDSGEEEQSADFAPGEQKERDDAGMETPGEAEERHTDMKTSSEPEAKHSGKKAPDAGKKSTGERRRKRKRSFIERIRSFFTRLRMRLPKFFTQFKARLQNFFAQLKEVRGKGAAFCEMLGDEGNKAAVSTVFGELFYLLKHFGIRRIKSDLTFSTGDPALTGQVLGVLCLLPFLYQKDVVICPDFEAETFYVRGELEASGHVRMIHLLVSAVRLIKEKNLRKLIKNFMK